MISSFKFLIGSGYITVRFAWIMTGGERIAYVVQHGFHQLNGHLSLLDKIVLGVFNFDPSSLLFRRANGFQAANAKRSADKHDPEDGADPRLLGGIKLEAGGADGLAGFDCDRDIGFQGLLPWLQECSPDRFIMLESGCGDFLPSSAIRGECRRKLVILGGCREIGDCGQGSPVKSVGESLVLDRFWLHGSGSGKVCSLEVGSGEVGNGRANGGGEIND